LPLVVGGLGLILLGSGAMVLGSRQRSRRQAS
jgi:hypothetical protein